MVERVTGFEPATSCLGIEPVKRRRPLASFIA
jgi:hypothetical protein